MSTYKRILKSEDVYLIRGPNQMPTGIKQPSPKAGEHPFNDHFLNGEPNQTEEGYGLEKIRLDAYQQGRADALAADHNKMSEKLKSVDALILELKGFKKQLIKETEADVIKLSLALAEKILHREIASDRDYILNILREMINSIHDREGVKIRLGLADFKHIMESHKEFLQGCDGLNNCIIEEDKSIRQGGAVIEMTSGVIDARVEQQMEELKRGLLTAVSD